MDVFIDLLASPLALTINITGATIVPVAGGLSNVEQLLQELDRTVRQRILRKFDRPLVVRSECRVEPGLIGAALLGLKAEAESVGSTRSYASICASSPPHPTLSPRGEGEIRVGANKNLQR
jgi:N-acetylglucosamine kinase